jgi:magnesium chelatase accessory protein
VANALRWEFDRLDWPHADTSRFVQAGGVRWHVQQQGSGPVVLLIHGTGSSAHTWRDVAPLLAKRFTVVAPDLPGHAFSGPAAGGDASLPAMALALAALVRELGLDVRLVVGHSAGAAIALRMVLDALIEPGAVVSVNGALLPFGGVSGVLFPPVARLMAATPFAARLFAWRAADPAAVQRLIAGTGSTLDARGVALYRRLVQDPAHAAGALAMMANWDLRPLQRDLARLKTPLRLIVGGNDRAVSPAQSAQVLRVVERSGDASLVSVAGAGHLAHEEQPEAVAAVILEAVRL